MIKPANTLDRKPTQQVIEELPGIVKDAITAIQTGMGSRPSTHGNPIVASKLS